MNDKKYILIDFFKTFGLAILMSMFITIYMVLNSWAMIVNSEDVKKLNKISKINDPNNNVIIDATIVIVNSYNINHPCSAPQDEGFRTELLKYKNINARIIMYDLYTKTKNITQLDQERIASITIEKIKRLNPDVVYTTDDNAFKLVGIPLSKKYVVVASGLNKFPEKYISEYKLDKNKNHIYFVSETVRLDLLWNVLEKSHTLISKVYIISEDSRHSSVTNYYMTKNYINEIKGRMDYDIIYVTYVSEFRKIILDLNKKKNVLVILSLQRLIDDNGNYINKLDIVKELLKTNYTNLELGGNFVFCKEGVAICVMPDFWSMGKISANISAKYILNKYFNANFQIPANLSVIIPPNKITVNKERLDQLGYGNILHYDRVFYKIFDKCYNFDDK